MHIYRLDFWLTRLLTRGIPHTEYKVVRRTDFLSYYWGKFPWENVSYEREKCAQCFCARSVFLIQQ